MKLLKQYRADYFVWDSKEDNAVPFLQNSLEKVFEVNSIMVYKIL